MNRRAALLSATATVAGVSASSATAATQMVVQNVSRYEVADASEAEAVLTRLVEGPGMTVSLQSFSLTANSEGTFDLIILSLNPV